MMIVVNLELAKRLETAEACQWLESIRAQVARHPGSNASILPIAGGQAVFNRAGSRHMHALALGLADPVGSEELEALESFYRARSVPPTIEICPLADPSLISLLRNRNYKLAEFVDVLFREVSNFLPQEHPSKVEIRKAHKEDAELWARL